MALRAATQGLGRTAVDTAVGSRGATGLRLANQNACSQFIIFGLPFNLVIIGWFGHWLWVLHSLIVSFEGNEGAGIAEEEAPKAETPEAETPP